MKKSIKNEILDALEFIRMNECHQSDIHDFVCTCTDKEIKELLRKDCKEVSKIASVRRWQLEQLLLKGVIPHILTV